MKEKNQSWVRLPLAVLQDKRLTSCEVIVLSLLIDRDTGTGEVSVSIKALAISSDISERHIKRCLSKLKELGYIDIHKTGRASIYTLKESILPPKKRDGKFTQKKKEKDFESFKDELCDLEHFEEDYEVFLNRF